MTRDSPCIMFSAAAISLIQIRRAECLSAIDIAIAPCMSRPCLHGTRLSNSCCFACQPRQLWNASLTMSNIILVASATLCWKTTFRPPCNSSSTTTITSDYRSILVLLSLVHRASSPQDVTIVIIQGHYRDINSLAPGRRSR